MTIEVELRLPSETMYSYANIKVTGNTVREVADLLVQEVQHLANTVGVTLGVANGLFKLGEGGIAGDVQEEAKAFAPTPPWKQQAAPQGGPSWMAPPTQQPEAQAPAPWDTPGPSGAGVTQSGNLNTGGNTFRVDFGYQENWDEFKKFLDSFYKDFKNSLKKKEGNNYAFFRQPKKEELERIQMGLSHFGGSIVSE